MVARTGMLICLILAICYTGHAFWQTREADDSQRLADEASVRATGLIVQAAPKHLASSFTDTQGRLLADPPTDPSKFADPATFVVGHLPESDPDSPVISWSDFDAYLSKAIGRPVTDRMAENGPSQIDKINAGQINIMALHAADTPFLVNNCGFQPVAVLGDESGASGNRLDLLVPAGSSLNHPEDLRGKTLTCTGPLSIVGYRAAIVLLMQNQQFRPNVDYYIAWSLGQKESIKGVADGTYPVAAVSDDKLNTMLASGKVKKDSCRIIYRSDVFPRTTIGYFYNLKPDLAQKVKSAILSYRPAAVSVGDADAEKPMHFLPVDYKKDFALIRLIDDQFDPRLESKAKHGEAATQP